MKLKLYIIIFIILFILSMFNEQVIVDGRINDNIIAEYNLVFYNFNFNFSVYDNRTGESLDVLITIESARVIILNMTNYLSYIFQVNGTININDTTKKFTQEYIINTSVARVSNIPIHYDANRNVIAGVPIYYVGPIVGSERFKPVFGFAKPKMSLFCVSRFNVSEHIDTVKTEPMVNGSYSYESPSGINISVSVPVEANESFYAVSPCVPGAGIPLLFPAESLTPQVSVPDDNGIVEGEGFAIVWDNGDAFVYVENLTVVGHPIPAGSPAGAPVSIIEYGPLLLELMKGSALTRFELSYNPDGFLLEGVVEVPASLSHIVASLLLYPFFTMPPEVRVGESVYSLEYHGNIAVNITSKAVVSGAVYYSSEYIVNVVEEKDGTGFLGLLLAGIAALAVLTFVMVRVARR